MVSYFSPGVKRSVKASSPPRGSSACWTERLIVRRVHPRCTSLGEQQLLPRLLTSSHNFSSNFHSTACLFLAHTHLVFSLFCVPSQCSRTSKTQFPTPLLFFMIPDILCLSAKHLRSTLVIKRFNNTTV